MPPRNEKHSSSPASARTVLDQIVRSRRIIEIHFLREEIAREEALRREQPEAWRRQEAGRVSRNRSHSELNRKLREAGCRPIPPELSLKQKMKKLQQLEAGRQAETAISMKQK
jgi:hypothetical protein